MKRLLLPLSFAAMLGGCVAVPYDAYNSYPPGYMVQQPAYVGPPPVYVGPPVYFGFGLNYSNHGHGGWGHGGGWRHGGHFRH